MVDSLRFFDWLKAGESDLKSAEILYKYDGDYGIVAFHCQQAIEKTLKGFLLKETQELETGHSLVFLIKKAQKIDEGFKAFIKDCAYINQFYIETRYPADEPMILEKGEAQECIKIVGQIRKFVCDRTNEKPMVNENRALSAEQLEKLKEQIQQNDSHKLGL